MSKPGLLRSLREFLRELRSFGNPELDNLKVQARTLQRELDELEAMRAAREKQEEALALMQVHSRVQNLQQLDKIVQKSEKMIAAAVEKAGAQTDQQIKDLLQQKAQQVISKLDLEKALSLDVPPEQIAADAMEQASAQLQAEGDQALNLMPDSQTPLAGSTTQASQLPDASKTSDSLVSHASQHQQKRQIHQQRLLRRSLHTYSSWHGFAAR